MEIHCNDSEFAKRNIFLYETADSRLPTTSLLKLEIYRDADKRISKVVLEYYGETLEYLEQYPIAIK